MLIILKFYLNILNKSYESYSKGMSSAAELINMEVTKNSDTQVWPYMKSICKAMKTQFRHAVVKYSYELCKGSAEM